MLTAAFGCGAETTTTSTTASPAKGDKGTAYVAVTGVGELTAGEGNMGMAIVDLATKRVEMVNIAESKAPHGIIFSVDARTAPDSNGRVALEAPDVLYLGNAEDGSVNIIDMNTKKVIRTINAPAGAKLAICGMQQGPDGKIYMSSMGDGRVYLFDPVEGVITPTDVGGGDVTQSICGIAWSRDAKYAYLSNMPNPANPAEAGYIAKVEWPSGKLVKKIENVTKAPTTGAATPMANQTEVTPDGKFMYITDGIDGALVKFDMETEAVVKTVPVGKELQSIVFSPDGKTAYITVRHEPIDNVSSIFVYDVEKDQVIDRIPGIPAPLVGGLIFEP